MENFFIKIGFLLSLFCLLCVGYDGPITPPPSEYQPTFSPPPTDVLINVREDGTATLTTSVVNEWVSDVTGEILINFTEGLKSATGSIVYENLKTYGFSLKIHFESETEGIKKGSGRGSIEVDSLYTGRIYIGGEGKGEQIGDVSKGEGKLEINAEKLESYLTLVGYRELDVNVQMSGDEEDGALIINFKAKFPKQLLVDSLTDQCKNNCSSYCRDISYEEYGRYNYSFIEGCEEECVVNCSAEVETKIANLNKIDKEEVEEGINEGLKQIDEQARIYVGSSVEIISLSITPEDVITAEAKIKWIKANELIRELLLKVHAAQDMPVQDIAKSEKEEKLIEILTGFSREELRNYYKTFSIHSFAFNISINKKGMSLEGNYDVEGKIPEGIEERTLSASKILFDANLKDTRLDVSGSAEGIKNLQKIIKNITELYLVRGVEIDNIEFRVKTEKYNTTTLTKFDVNNFAEKKEDKFRINLADFRVKGDAKIIIPKNVNITLILPKNAELLSVGPGLINSTEIENGFVLTEGTYAPEDIEIVYKIKTDYTLLIIGGILVVIIVCVIIYWKFKRK